MLVRLRTAETDQHARHATWFEAFFDLVFVFAFTEVTTFWLEHSSWGGLGRGLLVLLVLWWVWASYAWLTNAADAEAGRAGAGPGQVRERERGAGSLPEADAEAAGPGTRERG